MRELEGKAEHDRITERKLELSLCKLAGKAIKSGLVFLFVCLPVFDLESAVAQASPNFAI